VGGFHRQGERRKKGKDFLALLACLQQKKKGVQAREQKGKLQVIRKKGGEVLFLLYVSSKKKKKVRGKV